MDYARRRLLLFSPGHDLFRKLAEIFTLLSVKSAQLAEAVAHQVLGSFAHGSCQRSSNKKACSMGLLIKFTYLLL